MILRSEVPDEGLTRRRRQESLTVTESSVRILKEK